jgi:hypothetical protein
MAFQPLCAGRRAGWWPCFDFRLIFRRLFKLAGEMSRMLPIPPHGLSLGGYACCRDGRFGAGSLLVVFSPFCGTNGPLTFL